MKIQTYLNPIDNNWWAYYELKPLVIGKGRTKEEAVENLKHLNYQKKKMEIQKYTKP